MPPDMTPSGAVRDAKWTVMVFMGAATVAGNQPLPAFAEADLKEMQLVGSGEAGDGGELNVYAQVHQGVDIPPRRGKITDKMRAGIAGLDEFKDEPTDLARGMALQRFIKWAMGEAIRAANQTSLTIQCWCCGAMRMTSRLAVLRRTRAPSTRSTSRNCPECSNGFSLNWECPAASWISSGSMPAISRRWRWRANSSHLPSTSSAHRSVCHCRGGRTIESSTEFGIHTAASWVHAELGSYIVRRFCESYSAESRTVSLTLLDLNRAQELT